MSNLHNSQRVQLSECEPAKCPAEFSSGLEFHRHFLEFTASPEVVQDEVVQDEASDEVTAPGSGPEPQSSTQHLQPWWRAALSWMTEGTVVFGANCDERFILRTIGLEIS